MALSTLIRKASTLASLRAIGSSIIILNHSISRSFSSVESAKDLADANLDAILDRRIKVSESNLKSLEVNTDPPDSLPYKIDRIESLDEDLKLYCKFHDKDIFININRSKFNPKELETKTPSIPMWVHFDKNYKVSFEIIASPEDIIIQSLYVIDEEDHYSSQKTELKDLNYELRRSLHKYLEFKGINIDMAKFVIKTLIIEKNKTDLRVLEEVKDVTRK